jgi:hypothetical protein
MLISLVVSLAVTTSTPLHVPGGHVLSSGRRCVVELENGARYNADAAVDTNVVKPLNCKLSARGASGDALAASEPHIQIYAADTHYQSKTPLTSFTVGAMPQTAFCVLARRIHLYHWCSLSAVHPTTIRPPVLLLGTLLYFWHALVCLGDGASRSTRHAA